MSEKLAWGPASNADQENKYPNHLDPAAPAKTEVDRILEILQPLNPDHQNGVISSVRERIREHRECDLARIAKEQEYLKSTLTGI